MKVTKFGGSSLANGDQIRKVFQIIKADPRRKIVVVSAFGKQYPTDVKVTDLLISYYLDYKNKKNIKKIQEKLVTRFSCVLQELDLKEMTSVITDKIKNLTELSLENAYVYDQFLSLGETCSALILTAFFNKNGLTASFVSPKEAGILVEGDSAQATLLPQANQKIRLLSKRREILIIPGFFGITQKDEVCTFSRGGSDITGAIIAAGLNAELYENFTDVDGIYAANPNQIESPVIIEEITYREMRELATLGFNVIHHEALIPVERACVPMVLKNTNHPELNGTKIVSRWTIDMPLVGVSSSKGYDLLKVNKYMRNRTASVIRSCFEILEQLNISVEAMTTGIDDFTILIKHNPLSEQNEKCLIETIQERLDPDEVRFTKHLAIISAVGEEMRQQTHITSRATKALAQKKIKIETLLQGSSEVSLLFVVAEHQENKAVRTLYAEFFD